MNRGQRYLKHKRTKLIFNSLFFIGVIFGVSHLHIFRI